MVEIDAASNRGVDDARDLRERAMYAASGPDRFKVYIIDEAHMLTREAWNTLLKILEEPPPQVVFVFATTEPQKIANTTSAVLSRLQRFDFRNIGPKAIAGRLRQVADAEQISVEDDALSLIATVARGGMRDALSMLDQVVVFGDGSLTAARVREALGLIDEETYGEVLTMVAERRSADVFPFVARLVEQGADLVEFVSGVGETLRALMLERLGGSAEGLTETLRDVLARLRKDFTEGDVLRMLRLLEESEESIRRSPNVRLHVETLLLHWTLLDRTVEIADVLAALGAGERSAAPGRPPPQPSPAGRSRASGTTAARSRTSDSAARRSVQPAPVATEQPGRVQSAAKVPSTLEELQARWGEVVDALGEKNPLVRESLAETVPSRLSDDELTLDLSGGDVQEEGLKRHRAVIEDVVSQSMGRPLRVVFNLPSLAEEEGEGGRDEPRRQTQEDDRDARLGNYRAADPTLDRMAEALDLELTE